MPDLGTITGLKNRALHILAHFAPGARSLRVLLHRWRGVNLGNNVWIGYDVVLETSHPDLITIGDNTLISVRAMLIAHFRDKEGIRIEEDVFIGPGAIILPGVTIGRGAVVAAGSVVADSVAPGTLVQGNPARPIASCGTPLVADSVTLRQFYRSLRPIKRTERSVLANGR
jgi:acetyltransferase-like isoleucine patch superfamily enzyme